MMKINLLLLSFFLLLVPFVVNSQISNPGFEDWTDDEPDYWATNNIPELGLKPVQLSFDSYTGSYAVKLEVLDVDGSYFPAILQSGKDTDGFPVSQRYNNFYGYYKFSPKSADDEFSITVTMWKKGVTDPVGIGIWDTKTAVSDFTQFSVPIEYYSSETPDIIDILFAVGETPGAYALVDELSLSGSVNVNESDIIASDAALIQNFPNPFSSSTKIAYTLYEPSFVELKIYNVIGVHIATLVSDYQNSGYYQAEFNGEMLDSGIYIAKLVTSNFTKTLQMLLVK